MVARRSKLYFSISFWLAISLIAAFATIFILLIQAEKRVDTVNELRYQSLLLADEMRHSSNDLTRMARSYVVTGDPIYKQYYLDVIDIRDGRQPRPSAYANIYWDLVLVNKQPLNAVKEQTIALFDLMRQTGFSEQELGILKNAKANIDTLSATERYAMSQIETAGPELEHKRTAAISMLFGHDYDVAKAAIMLPINQFYSLMDKRTAEAVDAAERKAASMRMILIGLGLGLMLILWRANQMLRVVLGGPVQEVYRQIVSIGKGDFSLPIHVNDNKKNSVLGWLAETQRNLQNLHKTRLQVEDAKQESDARYRKLFDSAGIGIVIFLSDPEKTLLDGNPLLCEMLGYTLEELRALRPADVVAQEQVEQIAPAIDVIASKEDLTQEWRLKRKDGSTFSADVISTTMPDGTMMSMVRDITRRKTAEKELRHSEENLAITLQSIGDAVIATDANGLITRMNPTAERMTGWSLAEARGQQLSNIFHIINADTRKLSRNPVQLVMEHGEVVGLANHTSLIARGGREYQIADSAAPIRDAAGNIVGVVLVFSDVTERYEAQAALQKANERFRSTFKLIPTSVTLQTKDGVMLDCSDAFCEATGYTREEILNRDAQELNVWADPEQRKTVREVIQRDGQIDKLEFRLRRRNGELRTMQLSARFLEMEPAPILLAIAHDITERKQAEEAVRKNERFIATLAHNMPGMVSHWTKDLRCDFANKEYLTWFGKTAEQVRNSKPWEIIGEELFRLNEPSMREALQGIPQSFERTFQRRDGSVVSVWTQFIPDMVYDVVEGFFVIILNITERKEIEIALQESVFHTQAILDNMFDGVVTLNADGIMESFNKAASSIFGYDPAEVIGKNMAVLIPDHADDLHHRYLEHYLEPDDKRLVGTLREIEGRRKDGSVFPMSFSVSKTERHDKATFIGLIRDISQQRDDEEEIYRLAFYDPLTNLPNRRLLFDRLRQAILTSSRTDQHGALMFLDLDYFKQLNDSLGHDVGDILLQQVAKRLQSCVREGDSVARMGGDEFVMLIEALSVYSHEAATQAEGIAHKILAALSKPYELNEHTYVITPSIGIVMFLDQKESMDELLKKADIAMYQAKTAGRNNVRFFDPTMQAAVSMRVALEKSMRDALESEAFILYYQLQVDGNDITIGVEALVRWNHKEHGMISPAAFIPLAEETGMILPLGQWVLETACAQLVEWAKKPAMAHWTMAVNVSVSQFAQANFVKTVEKALQKTGASPHLLKLELTESMLVKDVEDVIIKMFKIKALGVTFSLDDFGTGYSSLSYLKRLPLDQLKIDQSFVRDLLTDPNDAAIARTIVALGQSLGLKVIAEGVETAEQRNALAEMGCDAYQGYYFARPVPIKDLASTIKNIPCNL